jgi:hypothetical protein
MGYDYLGFALSLGAPTGVSINTAHGIRQHCLGMVFRETSPRTPRQIALDVAQ